MINLTTSLFSGHIITNCPDIIADAGLLRITMSNHCLVYCVRKFNGARRKITK